MDYITFWDTQIIALEKWSIWFNYNVRKQRHLDYLANGYLSNCVKGILKREDNGKSNCLFETCVHSVEGGEE